MNNSIERTIGDFIRSKFRPQLHAPLFDDETPLFSSGIVDSFGVLELIAFLENTFTIDIDPARQELTDFDTVNKMAALVREKTETGST